MAKYISISTADGTTINKRFRIIVGGYKEQLVKAGEPLMAITGALDMYAGSVAEIFTCVTRVRHTEVDSDYGTRADLLSLFKLTNPNHATTPNRLTITDHFGTTFYGYLFGEMAGEPLTSIIIGTNGWFMYQFMLIREQ